MVEDSPSRTTTMLEELSMNAWPSLQTVVYDGWILRFSEGYSRRANSCHPLYQGFVDPMEKIALCEELYRGKGLRPAFKLTGCSLPPTLGQMLEKKGYARSAETSVQVLELAELDGAGETGDINLSDRLEDGWLGSFCSMSGIDEERKAVASKMMSSIIPGRKFASIADSRGEIVACGLAVKQGRFVGLFDIVTGRDHRRKGLGRRLTSGLLAWGRGAGAERAYLQVMTDNAPALSLYAGFGFREAYRYWYTTASLL